MKLHDHRKQYGKGELIESSVPNNPIELFNTWFELALVHHTHEANTVVLSTVSIANKPSARIVLLKEVSEGGFVFFSNYNSRKGIELSANPYACLTFFWPELEKQIRIEGKTELINEEESTKYFNSRPIDSRLSAIISAQSTVIPSKQFLITELQKIKTQPFENIKKPEHWGGYRLMPNLIEFWQGGADRLHDRIQYSRNENSWQIQRLAP